MSYKFPLVSDTFGEEETKAAMQVLADRKLTMGPRTKELERKFANWIGAKHAVMVNSGSSANLLMFSVLTNPMVSNRLKPGDRVLVPAIAWATSVAPIIQHGLVPVFVDVDEHTLNVDTTDLAAKALQSEAKAFLAIHILGNAANLDSVFEVCTKYDLLLLEDTCESMGSSYDGKKLGTFGLMGSYSSYFSHHITTGEGGFVVTDSDDVYNLLIALRSHGWVRDQPEAVKRAYRDAYPDVDPRFMFMTAGYNLRPTDMAAAFGIEQLKKVDIMNAARVYNRKELVNRLIAHPRYENQISFPLAGTKVTPIWFGFPFVLARKHEPRKEAFIAYLEANGVENRPIVSGNFAYQPMLELHGHKVQNPKELKGAEILNRRGLFIGVQAERMSDSALDELANILLGFNW